MRTRSFETKEDMMKTFNFNSDHEDFMVVIENHEEDIPQALIRRATELSFEEDDFMLVEYNDILYSISRFFYDSEWSYMIYLEGDESLHSGKVCLSEIRGAIEAMDKSL